MINERRFAFTSNERDEEVAQLTRGGMSEEQANAVVDAREAEANERLRLATEEERGAGEVHVPVRHEGKAGVSPDILRAREEQTAQQVEAALQAIQRQYESVTDPEIEFDPKEAPSTVDQIRREKERQTLERAGIDSRLLDEDSPRQAA